MSIATNTLPGPRVRSIGSERYRRRALLFSAIMHQACIGFAVVIVLLLALVTGYLLYLGCASISANLFLEDVIPKGMPGYPGGLRHGIVGTLTLIVMASSVGIPMGMLTGIYLSEYSSGSVLAAPVRFICDVLAGVPSIVVGILGYELLVRPMGNQNAYAGALALAFIMIPIVARTTEEMLRLVPKSYREASIALGASKAWTILRVVIPAATGSVVTGVMLAIARVAGETAPLLFTAGISQYLRGVHGPSPYIHLQELQEPFPSLTVQAYIFATGPLKEQKYLAWAGILVLVLLIFILNLAVRLTLRNRHKV